MEDYSDIAIKEALAQLAHTIQKVDFLCEVHAALLNIDPQRALRYSIIALNYAEQLQLPGHIAHANYNHGEALLIAADAFKAEVYFIEALSYFRSVDDKDNTARTINKIGSVYAKAGRYEQAIEYFMEAMQISRRLENKLSYAHSLNNIGTCHRIQGNFPQALNFIRQAIDICSGLGEIEHYSDMLCSIGIVCYQTGDYDAALEHYFQSLRLLGGKEITRISRVYNNVGNVYFALERYQQALDFHLKALSIRKEIGNQNLIGDSLNNCGNCYLKLGNLPLAMDHLTRAFEVKKRIKDARGEAYALVNLAKFYIDIDEFLKAEQLLKEAVEAISSKKGESEIHVHTLLNLGIIAIRRQNGVDAEKHLLAALSLANELKLTSTLCDIFKRLSELYSKVASHKDRHKALEYFKKYNSLQQQNIGETKNDAVTRLEIQFNTNITKDQFKTF
jgi:tetratricopeptide (TPR) repeat protein